MGKLIIMISEDCGIIKTTVRIRGNADQWWKGQTKKNQSRACEITNSNEVFDGNEDTHYYEGQLIKFLKRYEGLKNVEIVYI